MQLPEHSSDTLVYTPFFHLKDALKSQDTALPEWLSG